MEELVSAQERKKIIEEKRQSRLPITLEEKEALTDLTSIEEINDFYEFTEECMKKIHKLKKPTQEEISEIAIEIPYEEELKTKKLAIFDLDETLLHCEIKKPQKGANQIMINLPNGEKAKVFL